MKQQFQTKNDFYVFPEHRQLFDIRNYEVRYWHKSTYDTLSKFVCESRFNYAHPELFTGVCNGKLPNIDQKFIVETNENLLTENKKMYKNQLKEIIQEGVVQMNLDFEYKHRNKNKSFLLRNKTIRKYKSIFARIWYKLYF